MNNIYRVKAQSEPYFVQSQKAEGGQVSMCNVVLQELGGKFEKPIRSHHLWRAGPNPLRAERPGSGIAPLLYP